MNRLVTLHAIEQTINALQIRERLMLLAVWVLASLAVAEAVWLAPARQHAAQARQQALTAQSALDRLRAEATLQATSPGTSASPRAQLAQVNAQIDGVTHALSALMPTPRDAASLRQVLETFLQQHEGVTLVRAQTLGAEAPNLWASGTPLALPPEQRGLALTVAGPYAALVRYIEGLEQSWPDLRWGTMVLSQQEGTGTQLTVQVFVVGAAP